MIPKAQALRYFDNLSYDDRIDAIRRQPHIADQTMQAMKEKIKDLEQQNENLDDALRHPDDH